MTFKNYLVVFLFTIVNAKNVWAKDTLQVCSPSGKICVKVWMDKRLSYSVSNNNLLIVAPSFIDMMLQDGKALSLNNSIRLSSVKKITGTITSPVPEKRKVIPDVYNELSIEFKQPFKLQFRAYDDGIAYRITTRFKDSIIIKDEVADFNFPGNPSGYFQEIPFNDSTDMFQTSFENVYSFKKLSEFLQTLLRIHQY